MKKFILGVVLLVSLNVKTFSNDVVTKIEENWNRINSMSGQFKQTDADGAILHGNFYFLKPFNSKFIYNDAKENIVTNESLLFVVDQESYKIESYAIGSNIIKKLLSNEVSINKEFDLINIKTSENHHELQLKVKSDCDRTLS